MDELAKSKCFGDVCFRKVISSQITFNFVKEILGYRQRRRNSKNKKPNVRGKSCRKRCNPRCLTVTKEPNPARINILPSLEHLNSSQNLSCPFLKAGF